MNRSNAQAESRINGASVGVFAILIFVITGCNLVDRKTYFSPKPYLEDYLALRDHISKSYANLEYLLRYYKVDPYELNEKTVNAINASKSEKEAREVLYGFVKAFKDGHFQLKKQDTPNPKVMPSSPQMGGAADTETACKAMHFTGDKTFSFRFPISNVKVIESGGGEFPFLVIEIIGSKIGIIRIADFREEAYAQTCMESWGKYAKHLKVACDEKCRDNFLHQAMRKALVDKFYSALTKIRAAKVQALIIDLTHNGGGSDWVKDITALLTEKNLSCGRRGFIKHPHYANLFTADLNDLRTTPKPDTAKIAEVEQELKLVSESCERNSLWTKKGFNLPCSAVGYYPGDRCEYEKLKFKGKRKYTGKLFFLVDDHTASAAEDIVARHSDSKTATVVGGHTHGSGCGYMNGGIKFSLPNSGLNVKVPDCIRERADGTNEVVGIEPDIKIDMSKLNDPTFLSQLIGKVAPLVRAKR